ncbi:hypothetical protein MRX96_015377 [Rhipicephalus microplus]
MNSFHTSSFVNSHRNVVRRLTSSLLVPRGVSVVVNLSLRARQRLRGDAALKLFLVEESALVAMERVLQEQSLSLGVDYDGAHVKVLAVQFRVGVVAVLTTPAAEVRWRRLGDAVAVGSRDSVLRHDVPHPESIQDNFR